MINEAKYIEAQGQADLPLAQVLQDVVEDFRPCWHKPPKGVTHIFVFQESGCALENSWPGLSCLFFLPHFCKNLPLGRQRMRS